MKKTVSFDSKKDKICIVGLGYVGLPLAVLLSAKFNIIGFDKYEKRINELKQNIDSTWEISTEELKKSKMELTTNPEAISQAKIIIVTVPTPVDEFRTPDLTPVRKATETVGKYMSKNSVIVYESTVYPGVTEEICVPILEAQSGFKWKKDFNVGYSPERVNPGDKVHTTEQIVKVVSGDSSEIGDLLVEIYGAVIKAGIHKASNIKVAESAKVIENVQRDINIALINELSLIFHLMDIDTKEVLEAASTKWNFLKFEPGLVGGHCIGVDPYYLTFKAESLGYHPELILAGRRINDNMGKFIAENTVKKLIEADINVKNSKILILGLTFKENISDIRNSKVVDIYKELKSYGINVVIYDPKADKEEVKKEYDIELIDEVKEHSPFDGIIFAVKHLEILKEYNLKKLKELYDNDKYVLIDVKSVFDKDECLKEKFLYWRL